MADVVTKELKVRCYVDAQTGQLRVFEADMDKVSKATDTATKAMERQEQKIQRQTNGLIKMGTATTGLNKALGGLPNILVEIGDKFDNVERAGVKFGGSLSSIVSKLGVMGTAALAAGAAMAGWQFGRWISQITGLDNAIRRATDAMLGFGSAADSADAAYAKALNRLAQAGITNKKLNEDIAKANISAQQQIQDAFTSTANKLKAVQGEMHAIMLRDQSKFTAEENRAMSKRYADLAVLSAKYQVEIKTQDKQTGEERLREAERQAQERIKIEREAAEAIAKFQFQHQVEFAARQKEIAEKSAQELRDRIQEEIDAYEQLKDINIQLYLDEVAQAEFETAEKIKYTNQKIEEQRQAMQQLANQMGLFANILSRVGGPAGNVGASFFGNFAIAIEQGATKLQATLYGLGGALEEVGSAIGGNVGKIISAIGTLAAAFAEGGIVGLIIAGAAMLFNALVGLFKHDWKKDTQNIISAIHDIQGVSEELIETIAELGEQIGDTDTAFILSLNDIIDDIGVTKENFDQLAQAARDVFSFLERGQIDAAQATDILNGAFERLLEVGTDAFGRISPKLKEIIELAKRFGLEIPAITEFMQQQAQGLVDTFESLISGISDKAGAAGIADIMRLAFESLGGGPEAVAALGDAITAMREKLKELGLTMADVGLGFLNQLNNIHKKFPEATSRIDAARQALVLLDNMGELTAGRFKTLQDQIKSSFDEINKDGKVSRAELQMMAPTLALLADMAEQYGFTLDPALQKLIDMARAQGILKDEDAAPSMEESMSILNDTLVKVSDTMEGILLMLQQMSGMVIPITFDLETRGEYPQIPGNPDRDVKGGRNPQDGGRNRGVTRAGSEQVVVNNNYIMQITDPNELRLLEMFRRWEREGIY